MTVGSMVDPRDSRLVGRMVDLKVEQLAEGMD